MHFWYFTFKLRDEPSGYIANDRAVTSSADDTFPLELVETWAKEEIGESAQITITSTLGIPKDEYERLAVEIGVE